MHGIYVYRCLGRHSRLLELCENGSIGLGKADYELKWDFDRDRIRVFGKAGLTFKVAQSPGQIWSGFWEIVAPIPVELIPYWPGQRDERTYLGVYVRDDADRGIVNELSYNFGYRLGTLWMPHAPVIVDIGAHIGIFTVYAKRVRPEARVIAVEPNKENLIWWRRSCKGLRDVECKHAALFYGDSPKYIVDPHAQMFVCSPKGYEATFPTCTLEELAAEFHFEEIHFLKLDCEGAEFNILEHGKDWIKSHVHVIGGEYHITRPLGQLWEPFIDEHYGDWIHVRWPRDDDSGLGDFLLINPKSECAKYL